MTKEIAPGIKLSAELLEIFKEITGDDAKTKSHIEKLVNIIRKFRDRNSVLLQKREDLQTEIDIFFGTDKNGETAQLVKKLEDIGFIKIVSGEQCAVGSDNGKLATEITPMAGPQLVVPADKANMVLNAANARWGSLYNALYASNIIDPSIKDEAVRRVAVIKYCNDFLDKIIQLEGGISWNDVVGFKSLDLESWMVGGSNITAITKDNREISFAPEQRHKFVGVSFDSEGQLSNLIIENNGLKIEIHLEPSPKGRGQGEGIKDIFFESALTYIIDLEDASISAPSNKYESYRIIKGIYDKTLTCEVRGQTRKMLDDATYLDIKTLEKRTLKRNALPLVRDVGPHMVADRDMIEVDGECVPEKILDCYITSLIGMRYHVAPKMHGAEEVQFNVELWDEINKAQGLPENTNKIGIMNEELRTCAQLANCILAAKDIIFFTNTGFLDYTGSFIDLMMNAGAIAPYSILPSQTYKTEYEKHNVNVSLAFGVPQIGAGMWAEIQNMSGLLKSKESQVKGLTDTGWSPSPLAATLHAIAFHIFGNVREMQHEYAKNIQHINVENLFVFPKLDIANLSEIDKTHNLDLAIHGLIAYAEPWVRRGIGCSGIKDRNGVLLMEDRATARIKTAFVRNWLLHGVVTSAQVEDSIARMAKIVDEQNESVEGYKSLLEDKGVCPVIIAVRESIFNPKKRRDSYIEPYFYAAFKMNAA